VTAPALLGENAPPWLYLTNQHRNVSIGPKDRTPEELAAQAERKLHPLSHEEWLQRLHAGLARAKAKKAALESQK
jgi:hypothetical protein